MNNDSGYLKLGIFVLSGIAVLVAGIVVLGAGALLKKTYMVETVTNESVQGLDVGAPVKFRGVPLGRLAKIELPRTRYAAKSDPANPEFGNQIILELALDADKFPEQTEAQLVTVLKKAVDAGLRARIGSSGLTGPPYVELVFLDPKDNPPPQLAWTPGLPYIPGAPGTFTKIINNVEEMLEKIREADPGKLLTDTDQLVRKLEAKVDELDLKDLQTHALELIDEVRKSNQRVQQILDNPKVDQTVGDVGDSVARLRTTMTRIDEYVQSEQFTKMLDGLDQTTANAGPAAAELRQALREINSLLVSQRQDIASTLYNLQRTMQNIEALTEDLKQNPSRAIFGQPPPQRNPGEGK